MSESGALSVVGGEEEEETWEWRSNGQMGRTSPRKRKARFPNESRWCMRNARVLVRCYAESKVHTCAEQRRRTGQTDSELRNGSWQRIEANQKEEEEEEENEHVHVQSLIEIGALIDA